MKSQVGILVEYDEHAEREGIKIKAKCKDASAPKPMDALALSHEKPTEHVGERAIKPVHHISTHEEHEIESLRPPPEHTSMFLTIYFAMTGLHGIHGRGGGGGGGGRRGRAGGGRGAPGYF